MTVRPSRDRWVIYLLVFLALAVPMLAKLSVTPAPMTSSDKLYEAVKKLSPDSKSLVLVAMDWGPNSLAENKPQTEVVLEHLFRRRIKVGVFSLYNLAEPFLDSLPHQVAHRLSDEFPGETWTYGVDWVNLGYRPGGELFVQSFAKADNLSEFLKVDARGRALKDLPIMGEIGSLESVPFMMQITSLYGIFDVYVQFMQRSGHRPLLGHGCTSITVPEAYIYLDSGQIVGLLEGIAGAAWYSETLSRAFPARAPDSALTINTGLGVAHLVVLGLVLAGNIIGVFQRRGR